MKPSPGTIVVLIVAPFVAAADILHTYAPFLLLRLWLTCFAAYGIVLARAAGGFRRMWMLPYGLMGALFLFVWGLEVEQWGVIDLACAAMIAVSTLFLRSEPQRPSAQGAV